MNLFEPPLRLQIQLNHKSDKENNVPESTHHNKLTPSIPFYKTEDDQISGQVIIALPKSKNFKHKGIDIELEGQIQSSDLKFCEVFSSGKIHLEDKGTLEEDKEYKFSFEEFPRPIETCKNSFGKARYIIRATIFREFFSNITVEREIGILLNIPRVIIPRVSRLRITCGGQNRLCFYQDKRDYFLNDCIIGRLSLEENTPKLCNLSIGLVRKEEYRVKNGGKPHLKNELIDFINLNEELRKARDNGEYIPFKINLARYRLEPTIRLQTEQMIFSIAYVLKIRFQEDSGRGWAKEVRFNIWRESH